LERFAEQGQPKIGVEHLEEVAARLVRAMSGIELSGVRAGFQLHPPGS
jgi:hypothetical protein